MVIQAGNKGERSIAAPAPPETNVFSDIREIGQVFRTRRTTIALITILTALATAFWTVRQPKIYSATCLVEYDPDPPKPLGNNIEDVGEPNSGYWVNQEWYETQNRIIGSTAVLERVVRDLQLHRNREFMDVPPDQALDATVQDGAKLLRGRLIVKGVVDTRLVEITIEDVDRERATAIANTIADTYLNKSMEDRLGSTQRALEWLSAQLGETNVQLQGAEDELQRYKLTHDVLSVSLEDRQNIISTEIQRFNELLIDAKRRRIDLQARAVHLKNADREDPFDVHAPDVEQNPEVRQIAAEYRERMLEYQGLVGTYGTSHPSMKAVEGKLEVLQARLRKVIDGIIASSEAELAAAKDVETALAAALGQANDSGHQLNQQEIEYRRLDRRRKNTESLLELLLKRSAEADLAKALKLRYAQIADPATTPDSAIRPRVQLNILMGVLAGFFLGVAVAFSMHRMDTSVRSVDEAESLGLPVLGIIPSINAETQGSGRRSSRRKRRRAADEPHSAARDLIVHVSPRSPIAECCRTVRTNLAFAMAGAQAKTIVVTSPSPREGKTTTALSMAITFAQSGRRVVIVDTDLRKPRMHKALGLSAAPGVTNVIVGDCSLTEAVRETEVPNLFLLPAGPIPPNPAELLHTDAFQQLRVGLEQQFDTVVFDSPPLTAVVDAAIIGTQVDGVVVVAHARRTTRHALSSLLRQLRDVNARILGGVINDVNPSGTGYGYAYGGRYYYGGSYYSDGVDKGGTSGSGGDKPPASEPV